LFRRTKTVPAPDVDADADDNPQRKGRATPSRRESEARNKAKTKVPRTRKEMAAARRDLRTENAGKMRDAMRTGDEAFLPARDKGRVKKFIRDYVDSSLMMLELMIPVMFGLLVLSWVGSFAGISVLALLPNFAFPVFLVVLAVEVFRLRRRLKQELARRFPDDSHAGATSYAVMRAMQIRPWRKPERKVNLGQQLPERYR
jgi:Flp pilus assembly protein TadB